MIKFKHKLKKVMADLGINQVQVVRLTGKSRASVSMYLSGKVVPPAKVQREIAAALGLETDYFERDDIVAQIAKQGVIGQLRTTTAGRLMRMAHTTVEEGLKQGVFPWGYAIKTSDNHYRYFINAKRFAEIEGIEVPSEVVV